MNSNELLWVEKYRPSTINDCILPNNIKNTFKQIVNGGELHNMLLTGTPGLGKTTVAKALCNELNVDYILINGSEESGIDTLRTKIKKFASSVSLQGGYKVVILDEADYLNPQSTQPALRGFIEEFSGNCRFILTCNFKNRIIQAIHSRTTVIEFNIPKKEQQNLASSMMTRLMMILDQENVDHESEVLAELVMKHMPDWRRVINELQRYATSGKIDTGILSSINEINLNELVSGLKGKKFSEVRKWANQNIDQDTTKIFRKFYDNLSAQLKPQSIPQAVLIIADYQYKSAFVADQEINLVACLTEIMVGCEFK